MLILIIIIAFLIVSYILIYAKRVKRNSALRDMNSVDEFHKNYDKRLNPKNQPDASARTANYITKYNSTMDYREK